MNKALLAFGATAALAVGIPASPAISTLLEREGSAFDRFDESQQLVLEVHGPYESVEVYVLDTGLTRQDCLAAQPESHERFGVYYVCEPDLSR